LRKELISTWADDLPICQALDQNLVMNGLTRSELKALALHCAVADSLKRRPESRAIALRRLEWLREKNPAGARYYDEWRQLLLGSLTDLTATLTDESPRGCALRQESPFGDILTQRERAAIYRKVAHQLDATA
jgi:hypothetical protein